MHVGLVVVQMVKHQLMDQMMKDVKKNKIAKLVLLVAVQMEKHFPKVQKNKDVSNVRKRYT